MLYLLTLILVLGLGIVRGCITDKSFVRTDSDANLQFSMTPPYQPEKRIIFECQFDPADRIKILLRLTYDKTGTKVEARQGITFTGNAATGDISIRINSVNVSAGLYIFKNNTKGMDIACTTLYVLGKPTKAYILKSGDPELSGEVTFNCSSTSSTIPNDNTLHFIYNWIIDDVRNPVDNRIKYGNAKQTMTISDIAKTDKNKAIQCEAIENVPLGLTSDRSESMSINVLFGPEDIRFEPNDTMYKMVAGRQLPDIKCKADCNPLCTFTWTKDGQTVPGSTGYTLSLPNVTRTDFGNYTCTASRSLESVTKDLFIEVIYGPDNISVNSTTLKYSLEEHHKLSPIRCFAECWERCWYQWTGPVSLSPGAVLSLQELNRKEDGVYTCTATNNRTGITANIEITIEVTYGPDTITLNPPNTTYTILPGIQLEDIVCTAICNPLCNLVWIKDGHFLPDQSRNTLSLGFLNRSKAGIYTCMASRSSYSLRKNITVHVIYGPDGIEITPTENTYTYNEGQALEDIECYSECYPSCTYKWTKLSESFRVNHGTLSLGNLTRQERGLYICNATNPSTRLELSSHITVNVRYGPDKIILVPAATSHTVVEGDGLQNVSCSAEECWPECAQDWTNVTSGEAIGSGGTLSLGTSSRYFTGDYKCTSTNIDPEIQRDTDKSIAVTVSYFPVVNVVNETSIEATENDANISLLCLARGEPDRYTFLPWVQKALDLKTTVKQYKGVSVGNHNRLVLQHLSYMNSGLYMCSVTNNITNYKTGESVATDTLNVIVKGKPVVTYSEPIVDGATGKHVKLNVSFFSNDETDPSVTWFKIVNDTRSQLNISSDGKFQEMNSNDTVTVRYGDVFVNQTGKKTQLEISNIAKEDFGYYEIEIVNSIGNLSYRLKLVPRGPPSLPINFKVVLNSETTTSITLIWVPGFHGGANQTFHIEYKTSSTQWAKGPIIPGGKRSDHVNATVSDLLSGTEYIFQLYSKNIYGRKNISIFTTGTTSEVEKAEDQAASSNVGLIAGGAAGGVVLAAVIVVLVLLFLRRRKDYLNSPRKSLLNDKDKPAGTNGADDTPEINLNPMYESAGPLPSSSNNSDVYSQVDKNRKKAKSVGVNYSQVDKPKKRQNSGCSEVKNDVYAQVQKKIHKEKNEGKTKPKKQKPDKKTNRGKQREGELYDNVDTINSTVTIGDTVYENPSCSIEDEQPKQMRNKDELVYAVLDLPKETVGKDRKAIIHGLDDRTDYADIKYGEVGEQAPESDEENTKED